MSRRGKKTCVRSKPLTIDKCGSKLKCLNLKSSNIACKDRTTPSQYCRFLHSMIDGQARFSARTDLEVKKKGASENKRRNTECCSAMTGHSDRSESKRRVDSYWWRIDRIGKIQSFQTLCSGKPQLSDDQRHEMKGKKKNRVFPIDVSS